MASPTTFQSHVEPMRAKHVWLLANPNAGSGRGEIVAKELTQALIHAGYQTICDFSHPGIARVPWEGACPGSEWMIVVVGGDGTLRAAVARALEACDGVARIVPPILPVSMGTANLIGQYLDRPKSLLEIGLDSARSVTANAARHGFDQFDLRVGARSPKVIAMSHRLRQRVIRHLEGPLHEHTQRIVAGVLSALAAPRIVSLDVGDANGQLFLLMAGVGFDAHVVHVLDDRRRGPISLLSYAMPALSAMVRYRFPPLRIHVDGQQVFGPSPAVVIIANLPQYGIGMPLVPDAQGNDGLLDVLVLPCASRLELTRLLGLVAVGRHLERFGAKVHRGRDVVVESTHPVPVQIDGDPGGNLPLRAGLRCGQIRLLAPTSDPAGVEPEGTPDIGLQ